MSPSPWTRFVATLQDSKVVLRAAGVLVWLVAGLIGVVFLYIETIPFLTKLGWRPPSTTSVNIEGWPEYAALRKEKEGYLRTKFPPDPPPPPNTPPKYREIKYEGVHQLSLLVSQNFYLVAERVAPQKDFNFSAEPGEVKLHSGRAITFLAVAAALFLIPLAFRSRGRPESAFLLSRARMLEGAEAGTLPAALAQEALQESLRVRHLEVLAFRLSYAGVIVVFMGACAAWGLLPFWLSATEPFDFSLLTRPLAVFFGFSAFGAFLLRQARSAMEDVKYFNALRLQSVYRLASLSEMPSGSGWRSPEKVIDAILKEKLPSGEKGDSGDADPTGPSGILKPVHDLGSKKI